MVARQMSADLEECVEAEVEVEVIFGWPFGLAGVRAAVPIQLELVTGVVFDGASERGLPPIDDHLIDQLDDPSFGDAEGAAQPVAPVLFEVHEERKARVRLGPGVAVAPC